MRNTIFVFLFGLAVGGFFAVAVIREAVPLRDHVWTIGLSLLFGLPIVSGLIVWHLRLVRDIRRVFGQKGGEMIAQILSYQVVSTFLIILILISIFYAAIV
ncbi:MAG: hypothetical protein ACE5I1_18675 [bacterium]